jgi:manganese/iron transport system permease protein
VTEADLLVVGGLGLLVVALLFLGHKELLFATFDPLGAQAAGYPVAVLEYALLVLVALTIAVSIQVVGIILIVAMLVTPAATAQLLTARFARLLVLAALLSVLESVLGLYLSYYRNWASGATIVLIETAGFLLALLLSPRSGLVGRLKHA